MPRDASQPPPDPGVDEFSPTAAPLGPRRTPSRGLPPGPFLPPGSFAASPAITPVVGSVLSSLDSQAGQPPPPSVATEAATGVPRRAEETVDPLVGTILADRYRIDRRLGAGGMGAVYAGFHVTLNKRIALKVVQPRLGGDATIAQRFVQEARAASAIGHEHIVQITDFGRTADDAAFLVMEYLEGEDLSETLRREGPLPWQRVVHIGEQIAWALAAAHRQGIVHRDIKPANCYRVPREHDGDFIKVLDFGLAKVLAEQRDGESLTGTGMLLGTPGYIAPELYRGLKADHRVDIYALGALMHKLLTGELPPMASGSGAADFMRSANAPGAVVSVLKGALAEAPDERYGTAQELANALRAIPRVADDEPTQLGQVDGSRTQITGGHPRVDPGSAQAITLREPTPSTFPSLFTVERSGHRVRFYFGAPLIAAFVALLAGLVWYLTRPAPMLARVQADFEARQLEALRGTLFAVAAEGTAKPPNPAAPPEPPVTPATPPPPELPPELPPEVPPPAEPATPTPPEPTVAPTPDPKDMPPGPATRAPVVSQRGTPEGLARCLTRKCGGDTLAYTVELAWQTDEEGKPIRKSIVAKTTNPEVRDCAAKSLRQCPLSWDPDAPYEETVTIGMRAKKSP